MSRTDGGQAAGEAEGKGASISFLSQTPAARSPLFFSRPSSGGWTLVELVITMTVMTILTLAVIPMVKTSVRRQKEQRLRESLREIRSAIDEFHRDTVGMQCAAGGISGLGGTGASGGGGLGDAGGTQNVAPVNPNVPGQPGQGFVDPRSRVVISDCSVFGVDNPDRYPPDLQTLVDGVDVVPRSTLGNALAQAGRGLDSVGGQATDNAATTPKKKRYLREIPVDPITGKADWCVLSNYDSPDEGCSANPANVFDVRSKADGTALNGEKYSDW
jgi:general secretion pathway protein G